MKNYKVYLIKDKTNKIVYCGLTGQTLEARFKEHVYLKKLNKNIYKIELVQEYLTKEEAALLERMLIKQYNLLEEGLNRSPGTLDGQSVEHSEKTKRYLSLINKGKVVSPEHAAKNRVARLGKKNSGSHNKVLLESIKKPVMCVETGKIYPSAKQAAKELNLCSAKISSVCCGTRKTTGKLHFIHIKKQ